MTKQELINALNDTEAERVRWMTAALTAGNEIAALKAQVNCLRSVIMDFRDGRGVLEPVETVLSKAPEHCLAEVKAKAIEDYKKEQAETMRLDLATKIMMIS